MQFTINMWPLQKDLWNQKNESEANVAHAHYKIFIVIPEQQI